MSLFLVRSKKEKEIAQIFLMTNLMELLADWQYLAAQTHSDHGVDLFSGGQKTMSLLMRVYGSDTHLIWVFFPAILNSVNLQKVLDYVNGMPICTITFLTNTILHQCLAPQGTEEMNLRQVYKILRNGNIDILIVCVSFF